MPRIPLLFWLACGALVASLAIPVLPFKGFAPLSVWGYVILGVVLTQTTIMMVTIYLHRTVAHSALELGSILTWFFRLWCWLMSGMQRREWGKVHRAHHKHVETEYDPHSPVQKGLGSIMLYGADYYKYSGAHLLDHEYIRDIPADRFDRFTERFDTLGITISFIALFALFGAVGALLWCIAMAWIPIFAAGVINGIGHAWGYRNFNTQNHKGNFEDASTNIVPWGLFIGGEELHNNHHAFATSAKFSVLPGEFDIGWMYICVFRTLRLLRVKRAVYRAHGAVVNPVRAKNGKTYECIKLS